MIAQLAWLVGFALVLVWLIRLAIRGARRR